MLDDGYMNNIEQAIQINASTSFIYETSVTNKLITVKEELIEEINKQIDSNIDFKEDDVVIKESLIMQTIADFKKKQDEFIIIKNKLNDELKKNKNDIDTLTKCIKFTSQLESKYFDGNKLDIISEIKNNIEVLSNNIKKNTNITQNRKEYDEKRVEIIKYLQLIRLINNFNIGNTCSLCMTNTVDTYLDPCGHTSCKECIDRLLSGSGKQCFICRKVIDNTKPLYFI